MKLLDNLHGRWVHQRRVEVLAEHLARIIPLEARTVLDVGCGDGRLTQEIRRLRPTLDVRGLDVFVRPGAAVPVTVFDGRSVPFNNKSFDIVMFVDVLHHTEDPLVLLGEAVRVSRMGIAIKDHLQQGMLSWPRLRFMDWLGNATHGVALPYNYWDPDQWQDAFHRLGLQSVTWLTKLGLYPVPANLIFEQSLHFVAFLEECRLPSDE